MAVGLNVSEINFKLFQIHLEVAVRFCAKFKILIRRVCVMDEWKLRWRRNIQAGIKQQKLNYPSYLVITKANNVLTVYC
jgi:hypothetical protein